MCANCFSSGKWCFFILALLFRTFHTIWSHLVWILVLILNCLYFQLWKSYDILIFWLHCALCVCVPSLKRNNMASTVMRMIQQKRRTPDKSLKDIYLEDIRKTTEFTTIKSEEIDENERMCSESQCCALPGYIGAIEAALLLYRFRTSVALLQGTIEQQLNSADVHSTLNVTQPLFPELWRCSGVESENIGEKLWPIAQIAIYLDVVVLWLAVLMAYCRQCRLCVVMGMRRCFMWTIFIVVFGLICMELPMRLLDASLNASDCRFIPHYNNTLNESMINP